MTPEIGLALAIGVLSVLDVVTTLKGAKAGLVETNPIMAWLMKTLGTAWIIVRVGGAIGIAMGLLYLPHPISLIGLFVVAFLYGIVVWNNYRLLR